MLETAPTDAVILEVPAGVEADGQPRVWTVFLAYFAALVGAIGFQAVLIVIAIVWWTGQGAAVDEVVKRLPEKLATVEMFILLASCAQVAMLLTICVAAWLSPIPWRERLGLVAARTSWKANLLATVGSLVPLAIGIGMVTPLSELLPGDPSTMALLENMKPAEWVLFIVFIALVPPVVEEILFRGYMQRRLLARWRPLTAIGVTSLLFAAMHVMPLAALSLLPLSVWLGIVGWRAGSVYPTMLCHAFINGGVNVWRMLVKFSDLSETAQTVVVSVILLGSLVCLVLAWRELFGRQVESGAGVSELTENRGAVGG